MKDRNVFALIDVGAHHQDEIIVVAKGGKEAERAVALIVPFSPYAGKEYGDTVTQYEIYDLD